MVEIDRSIPMNPLESTAHICFTIGAAHFSVNANFTKELFLAEPMYKLLLMNHTYHNLDEAGQQIEKKNVIAGGKYAISHKYDRYVIDHGQHLNKGKL